MTAAASGRRGVLCAPRGALPDAVPHFLIWDRDDPNVVMVSVGKSIADNPANNKLAGVDAHTAAYLDAPDFTRGPCRCAGRRRHLGWIVVADAGYAGRDLRGLHRHSAPPEDALSG